MSDISYVFPPKSCSLITPSDTMDLPQATIAITVGTAGALRVTNNDGNVVTIPANALAVGVQHLMRVKKVWYTGTTAAEIVGWYPQAFALPPEGLSGIVLWLDAALGVTDSGGALPDDAEAVDGWVSRDSNAVTFAEVGDPPVYDLAELNNNLPAVTFDDNDSMLTATPITVSAFHLFVVLRLETTDGALILYDEDGEDAAVLNIASDDDIELTGAAATASLTPALAIPDSVWHILEIDYDGTTIDVRINGYPYVSDTPETAPGAITFDLITANAGANGAATYAEIIMTDNAPGMSDAAVVRARQYLANKYNITLEALPEE